MELKKITFCPWNGKRKVHASKCKKVNPSGNEIDSASHMTCTSKHAIALIKTLSKPQLHWNCTQF